MPPLAEGVKNEKPPQIQEKRNCKRHQRGFRRDWSPETGEEGAMTGTERVGPEGLATGVGGWPTVTDRKERGWKRETREAQGRPRPGRAARDREWGEGKEGGKKK